MSTITSVQIRMLLVHVGYPSTKMPNTKTSRQAFLLYEKCIEMPCFSGQHVPFCRGNVPRG